ncbi:hypothetical protein [Mucilaginibacter agri]|uniref:Uncharacterized protein n=1 Tax=Mucilaginibacter agri TaxID=2695265 RepID=A0A965ZHT8_9SPHI|nr:hypothetical protein [Mucilaginibacter agri]NCD70970.1 hypothetical protein [Mucilaginibacter agri]
MKLIVTANKLNVRSHIPKQLPEPDGITGQVLKGHTFDGILVTDPNISNGALGNWYQDTHGSFYWGNGLVVVDQNVTPHEAGS